MKTSELSKYLTVKLRFEAKDQRRHTHYLYRTLDGKLPLPSIICHSKGSGEVTNKEIGSLARSFGLNETNFKQSVSCKHCRECDLICFLSRLILESNVDSNIFPPDKVSDSLMCLLNDIRNNLILVAETKGQFSWNSEEKKSLKICKIKLNELYNNRLLSITNQLINLIDQYWD